MLHPLRIRCEQANWKVSNIVNCISSNHCVCTILYRLFASCDTKSLRSRIYAVQTLGTSRCGLCAWYRDWLLWSAGVSSVLQHMNHGWSTVYSWVWDNWHWNLLLWHPTPHVCLFAKWLHGCVTSRNCRLLAGLHCQKEKQVHLEIAGASTLAGKPAGPFFPLDCSSRLVRISEHPKANFRFDHLRSQALVGEVNHEQRHDMSTISQWDMQIQNTKGSCDNWRHNTHALPGHSKDLEFPAKRKKNPHTWSSVGTKKMDQRNDILYIYIYLILKQI